ncbi:MAG: hypothetical protein A3D92_24490 [Bacteroidetes bacterium RIFCSPHIGHO2_02_FULL_44_7]|nr:MAG: hypothetical protein A3D92_24490 [Bacteroidetes bacterium RIFCSPHIGHO2_02_FULL_44_7]
MKTIGRQEEMLLMQALLKNEQAHMLALIGRRRVGKTFLIREVYRKHIVFEMTGLKDASFDQQLTNFALQFNRYFEPTETWQQPSGWLEAFHVLTEQLERLSTKGKKVVFFDELPWIASKRSGFTEALAHWWNNWASTQNIIVVVCGSAAAWMLDHIVNAKGGLHNRITHLLHLAPFTLGETKKFLESRNIRLSLYQMVQLYMVTGGIPHYLEQVEPGKSAAQNIQAMCFNRSGLLRHEFENLYAALFSNASNHIQVIKALASKTKGLDRQKILDKTKFTDGGWFSQLLAELEASGFIHSFQPLENKKKEIIYRLTDEYSLFYLHFIDGTRDTDGDYWMSMQQTQEYKIWCGYAFENVCMKHVPAIKKALGISGIQSRVSSFLHRANDQYDKGFQIDLLIDRKDDVLTICEMKFYSDTFTVTADYAKKMHVKREGLKAVMRSKKMVQIAFVSTFGVADNEQKIDYVDQDLRMECLFQ